MSYKNLSEVRDEIFARSLQNVDYTTTLPDFIDGLVSPTKVNTPDGELVLTPNGFQQLVKTRLNLPPAIFEDAGLQNETKLLVLRDKARAFEGQEVRVRRSGNMIDGIVSADYSFFDNRMLIMALWEMQQAKLIPTDAQAMQFYLSPNGRDMQLRLIAPELWNFNLREDDRRQSFLGNLVISNNELGVGSFQAKVAVTRHACLNSTVGSSVWKVDHRLASYDDFIAALRGAVDHVRLYADEMMSTMRRLQDIEISSPLLIFEKIGQTLKGIPRYALNGAIDYWRSEGEKNTLYDITQAVAAGVREMTIPAGRRRPNWTNRVEIEHAMWGLTTELETIHSEGNSLEDWYLTGNRGLVERIALYVESFSPATSPVQIADSIRGLELE